MTMTGATPAEMNFEPSTSAEDSHRRRRRKWRIVSACRSRVMDNDLRRSLKSLAREPAREDDRTTRAHVREREPALLPVRAGVRLRQRFGTGPPRAALRGDANAYHDRSNEDRPRMPL